MSIPWNHRRQIDIRLVIDKSPVDFPRGRDSSRRGSVGRVALVIHGLILYLIPKEGTGAVPHKVSLPHPLEDPF